MGEFYERAAVGNFMREPQLQLRQMRLPHMWVLFLMFAPLHSLPIHRSRRAVSALALVAAVGLVAVAVATGSTAPQSKLGLWGSAISESPELVYIPSREAQQLLAQHQSLNVIYSPEGQTDMWIKIAEAIDHDAVNNPALPPVSDEIQAEAARAAAEQQAEYDAQQAYNQGQGSAAPVQTLMMGGQEYALVPMVD